MVVLTFHHSFVFVGKRDDICKLSHCCFFYRPNLCFFPAVYFLGVMQAQVGMQGAGPVPMERGQGKY